MVLSDALLWLEKNPALVGPLFRPLKVNVTVSNSSVICDPWLFTNESHSRENYPIVTTNNICPDTIFVPIVAAIFMFVFLVVSVVGVSGMIWKRKSGYFQARNVVYISLGLMGHSFTVLLTCLRFLISRKVFPCFIYTLCTYCNNSHVTSM